jgi:hypothetical protein
MTIYKMTSMALQAIGIMAIFLALIIGVPFAWDWIAGANCRRKRREIVRARRRLVHDYRDQID